jgi:hypothetical protein
MWSDVVICGQMWSDVVRCGHMWSKIQSKVTYCKLLTNILNFSKKTFLNLIFVLHLLNSIKETTKKFTINLSFVTENVTVT